MSKYLLHHLELYRFLKFYTKQLVYCKQATFGEIFGVFKNPKNQFSILHHFDLLKLIKAQQKTRTARSEALIF